MTGNPINPKWNNLSAWNQPVDPDALAANLSKMDLHDGTPGKGVHTPFYSVLEEDLNDLERLVDSMTANKRRNFGERQAATNDAYEAAVILRRIRDGLSR